MNTRLPLFIVISLCLLSVSLSAQCTLGILSANTTNSTCSNGSISISVSGGTPGYIYEIYSGPAGLNYPIQHATSSTSYTFSSLPSGSYGIYVYDSNTPSACTDSQTDVVVGGSYTPMNPSVSVVLPPCSSTAQVSGNPGGGSPPYSFELLDLSNNVLQGPISSSSIHTFTGVSPGSYKVRITDNCGIGLISSAFVNNPSTGFDLVTQNLEKTSCGSVQLNVDAISTPSGSALNQPLQYTATGPTTIGPQVSPVFNLPQTGTYTINATDACGNTDALTGINTVPQIVGFHQDKCDGTFNLQIAPGDVNLWLGDVEYKITGPTTTGWQTTNVFTSVSTGTYTLSVRDDCGYQQDITGYVVNSSTAGSPGGPVINNVSQSGDPGDYTLNVDGLGDFYQIVSGPVTTGLQTTGVFEDLVAGTYVIEVTKNCSTIDTTITIDATCPSLELEYFYFDINCSEVAQLRFSDFGDIDSLILLSGPTTPKMQIGKSYVIDHDFLNIPHGQYEILFKNSCDSVIQIFDFTPSSEKPDLICVNQNRLNFNYISGVETISIQVDFIFEEPLIGRPIRSISYIESPTSELPKHIGHGSSPNLAPYSYRDHTFDFWEFGHYKIVVEYNGCNLFDTLEFDLLPNEYSISQLCDGLYSIEATSYFDYSHEFINISGPTPLAPDVISGSYNLFEDIRIGCNSSKTTTLVDSITLGGVPDGIYLIDLLTPFGDPYPKLRDTIQVGTSSTALNLDVSGVICNASTGEIFANASGSDGNYTYKIRVQGSGSWTTQSDPLFTGLTGNTTYEVQVEDGCGNQITKTYTLVPYGDGGIHDNSDCINKIIDVYADTLPGAIYTWTGPNGFYSNSRFVYINPFTALNEGDYTLQVQYEDCIDDSYVISIGGSPSVSNTTSASALCENGTRTLTGTPAGGTWSIESGGGSISGSTYSAPNISSATTVTIRYTYSDGCASGSDDVSFSIIDNVTNGGLIGNSQSNCGEFNPAAFTNTGAASGGSGATITYQWQQSSTGTGGWSDISGATSATYNPPMVSTTTYYRRRAKRGSCTSWVNSSNTVNVTITGGLTSAGSIGSDQSNCGGFDPSLLTNISSPSGGSGTIEYQWQSSPNGATWNNISGATSATYNPPNITSTTYYRRNARTVGCASWSSTTSVVATVTQNVSSAGSIGNSQDNCGGFNPSTFTSLSAASGGSGSVQYQWQVSNTGMGGWSNISGATSATYNPPSITSTKYYRRNARTTGCAAWENSNTVSAEVFSLPSNASTSKTNPTTCGGNNGSITVSAPSGANIQYSRNGGTTWQSSNTFTGLSAGTYQIRVRNTSTGCLSASNVSVVLSDPSAPSAPSASSSQVFCSGGSATVADLQATGTNIQWYGSVSSTIPYTTSTALIDGNTYYASQTVGGCESNRTAVTVSLSDLVVNAGANTTICEGQSTTLSASASSGQAPYTYTWDSGLGLGQSHSVSPTPSGYANQTFTYTVSVSDNNGCSGSDDVTVTVRSLPQVTTSSQEPLCANSDGSITFTYADHPNRSSIEFSISGVSGPYVSRPDNSGSYTFSGLDAGSYDLYVRWGDASCPKDVSDITLTAPPDLHSVLDVYTPILCFGDSSAEIGVKVLVGGTPPYSQINWYSGSIDPSNEIIINTATSNGGSYTDSLHVSGLPTGTYILEAIDANGCQKLDTQIISTTLTPFSITTNGVDATTNGGTDGSASVSVTGGTPMYSYEWPNGSTSANATGLSAGTYIVTITDDNGCKDTASVVIDEPSCGGFSVGIASSANVSCFGLDDGAIDVTPSGGVTPYTYQWSNGETTEDLSDLPLGDYTLTVTDAVACEVVSTTLTIKGPSAPLSQTTLQTNATTFGGNEGTASISAAGGTTPYSYLWSTGATTSSVSGLSAGTYTFTVTDANGCTSDGEVTIENPDCKNLTATLTASTDVSCFGLSDGEIDLSPSGGTPPYTYNWSNGQATQDISNLLAGTYSVTLTDSINCADTIKAVTISQPSAPLSLSIQTQDALCFSVASGFAEVTPSGATSPYTYDWSGSASTADTANDLLFGSHQVIVTDQNGCQDSLSFSIDQPSNLITSVIATNPRCFGESSGDVSVVALQNTATPPFSFTWPTGFNNSTEFDVSGTSLSIHENLPAGSYTVTVTDANGCNFVATTGITDPPKLEVENISIQEEDCGFENGQIVDTAYGGTAPLSYLWTVSGQTTPINNNVPGIIDTLIVTDFNGCVDSLVTDLPAIYNIETQSLLTQTTYACAYDTITLNVSSNGTIDSTVWSVASNLDTSITFVPTAEDTLVYVEIFNERCRASDTLQLDIIPLPTLEITGDTILCAFNQGNLTAQSNTATQYLWNTSDTTQSIEFIVDTSMSGVFTVTVTDDFGCSVNNDSLPLILTILPSPTAQFDTIVNSIFPDEVMFIDSSYSDIVSWSWDFGDGWDASIPSPKHLYTTAGTFEVVLMVENSDGCTDRDTVILEIEELLEIPNVFTPNNDGYNDLFYIRSVGMQEFDLMIMNRWGEVIFTSTSNRLAWDGTSQSGLDMPEGTYFYMLKAVGSELYERQGTVSLLRD